MNKLRSAINRTVQRTGNISRSEEKTMSPARCSREYFFSLCSSATGVFSTALDRSANTLRLARDMCFNSNSIRFNPLSRSLSDASVLLRPHPRTYLRSTDAGVHPKRTSPGAAHLRQITWNRERTRQRTERRGLLLRVRDESSLTLEGRDANKGEPSGVRQRSPEDKRIARRSGPVIHVIVSVVTTGWRLRGRRDFRPGVAVSSSGGS